MEFSMSQKELDRITILNKVIDGHLTQIEAGRILKLTDRQIRNILKKYKTEGVSSLLSKKRGKPSNRSKSPSLKSQVINIYINDYQGFGPLLFQEKLLEMENIKLSYETIRKWLIEKHLHTPKIKKRKIHLPRKRRPFFGEMLQGDGSFHDWFENGNKCTLIYFIDDATNIMTSARFEERESLDGYFEILKEQVEKYGKPVSIYTDRFSVFESGIKKENLTQFRRALKALDIEWIGANSPQAKGRIERNNRTLQDRLVKELRLKGIKEIDKANEFLKNEFLNIYNNKFSKKPEQSENIHRPLERNVDLNRTLSKYEERILTKDLVFQFQNIHYKIIEPEDYVCIGKKIEIRINRQKEMRVFLGNKELEFKGLDEIMDQKSKELIFKDNNRHEQSMNHPWKKASYRGYIFRKEHKCYNYK